MLGHRLISAVVALPPLVALIWIGVPTTAALVSAASALAFYEFHRLSTREGPWPLLLVGVAACVLFIVDAAMEGGYALPLVTGSVLAPLALLLLRPAKERLPVDWAWTVAGIFLVGWTLRHAVLLRQGPEGREWLLTAVALVFAVDTGAYLVGRTLGRRRLAPAISPGKTWEGALAGLLLSIPAAIALKAGFDLEMSLWQAAVLGLLASAFAQGGDLAESMIKRAAGAKEAGWLIPGHGGVLDRLDSLIPATLVVYYFRQYVLG